MPWGFIIKSLLVILEIFRKIFLTRSRVFILHIFISEIFIKLLTNIGPQTQEFEIKN